MPFKDNDKAKASKRKYYHERPEVAWQNHLKGNYGITVEEWNALCIAQSGRCKLCNKAPKKLHIDHDHETGKIRGLLCVKCNVALGSLGDNKEGLARALKYVSQKYTPT